MSFLTDTAARTRTARRTGLAVLTLAATAASVIGCGLVRTGSTLSGSPVSAGCGFGTSTGDVTRTIRCSGDAIARQDALEVCALQTTAARAESAEILLESGARTCVAGTERAFAVLNAEPGNRAKLKQVASHLSVSGVQVHGGTAGARVSDGTQTQQVVLRVENGGWRLEHSFVKSS